jgi:hypothetical protein
LAAECEVGAGIDQSELDDIRTPTFIADDDIDRSVRLGWGKIGDSGEDMTFDIM